MASSLARHSSLLTLIVGLAAAVACGGEDGPEPIADGVLALDGSQVVSVDTEAATVTAVGQPVPASLLSPRLLASLDNRRVMLTGSTSGTGTTAMFVMRFGSWEEVVTDATAVFTTVDLRWYGFRRDVMSAEPGMKLFDAEGAIVYETTDSSARVTSSLDGRRAFIRDGEDLLIFEADGTQTMFNPMLVTDWRPRLATASRVLLGPSDIGSWYSFDGMMGDTVAAEGGGVGYLLEDDGRLTYALDDEDVEVATMLPPDATRAITSDASQVLIDDGDSMRVFSPDGMVIDTIAPEVYAGPDLPAGATAPDAVRLGDVAAAIPNAGVFVTNQSAAGTASLATIVRFSVDGTGVTQEDLAVLPALASGDHLGDRPDERVVPWADGTEVHYVDPLTGETGSFGGFTGAVTWARYPGGRGHRLPGD